jgi:hypothetical protein
MTTTVAPRHRSWAGLIIGSSLLVVLLVPGGWFLSTRANRWWPRKRGACVVYVSPTGEPMAHPPARRGAPLELTP